MSSNDCYEIGLLSYKNRDYYYSSLWLLEAMKRLETDKSGSNISKSDILEYLSISSYRQGKSQMIFFLHKSFKRIHFCVCYIGNKSLALQYTNDILDILPADEKANRNKNFYEKSLQEETNTKFNIDEKPSDNRQISYVQTYSNPKSNETLLYKKLCRNEIHLTPAELSKLKCKYVTNRSPFLKIAPLKLEEAYLKPYIVIYHDVMSDVEIDVIKKMAKPRVFIHNNNINSPNFNKNVFFG